MYHNHKVQISQKKTPQRNKQEQSSQNLIDKVNRVDHKLVTRKIVALRELISLKVEQMDRIVRILPPAYPVVDDDVT